MAAATQLNTLCFRYGTFAGPSFSPCMYIYYSGFLYIFIFFVSVVLFGLLNSMRQLFFFDLRLLPIGICVYFLTIRARDRVHVGNIYLSMCVILSDVPALRGVCMRIGQCFYVQVCGRER